MFAWHTGLRTRIPAYVSAYSYVRMQVWHSSVYPWAYAASARGSNLVYMHNTARADTGEGFTGQTRDTKSGGGGGGGGGTLQALYPPLYGILTYSMVIVTSLLGGDPTPPPHPSA